MDPVSRRSTLAAAATLALVACSEAEPDQVDAEVEGAGDPREALAKLAVCEEENRAVTAWVEEYRGALPTDHDELARLPSAYRLGVFLALPPASASALMQRGCVGASRTPLAEGCVGGGWSCARPRGTPGGDRPGVTWPPNVEQIPPDPPAKDYASASSSGRISFPRSRFIRCLKCFSAAEGSMASIDIDASFA